MTSDTTLLGLLQVMKDMEGVLSKDLDHKNGEEYIHPS